MVKYSASILPAITMTSVTEKQTLMRRKKKKKKEKNSIKLGMFCVAAK